VFFFEVESEIIRHTRSKSPIQSFAATQLFSGFYTAVILYSPVLLTAYRVIPLGLEG
jgi:hypothetical protein